jgi:hypothetical protein
VLIHRLTPPFTMIGSSVAKVEKSKHKDFPEGNLSGRFCMLQCYKCNLPSGSVLIFSTHWLFCQTAASQCNHSKATPLSLLFTNTIWTTMNHHSKDTPLSLLFTNTIWLVRYFVTMGESYSVVWICQKMYKFLPLLAVVKVTEKFALRM